MIKTKIFSSIDKPNSKDRKKIIDFIYKHLENFNDPKAYIGRAVKYVLKEIQSFGGFIIVAYQNRKITGIVVVNQTGMKDYIHENIIIYIAIHQDHRGEGIEKKLLRTTIGLTTGSISLYIDKDNPARSLYEEVGFTSKHIEMRLIN